MTLQYLLEWQNLIFILPFVGAVFLLLTMAMGGISSEAEIDHNIDIDHDLDLAHEVDLDHGLEHNVDLHHETSLPLRVLSFFGVGRVPVSVVIVSFCLTWGLTGWTSNQFINKILPWPWLYVWASVVIALLLATVLTRWIAHGLAKIMPSTETQATKAYDLIGKEGTTLHTVTTRFGEIRVRDKFGNLQSVNCRIKTGDPEIPKGTRALLMSWQSEGRFYLVQRNTI